ncbi:MAG: TraR/DksA C4-type zinc finger protein [Bacteroidetes bacterium]|nr:TraR/DksA C4-type zinc finger protein [Bacteroidota bacterium]
MKKKWSDKPLSLLVKEAPLYKIFMISEEKNTLKKLVALQIAELEKEIELLESTIKPISPDSAYGRVSRMDAINNQAISEAALRDKKTLLDRMNFALTKIDHAEYGFCFRCKEEIAFNRLKSIPYASHCIKCAGR